jgi:hypothetical protein
MSAAAAGSRLILMVVGNMVGGIVAGHLISRSRHYKAITTIAVGLGSTCYLLVLIRWRGSTAWYDTAIVILGGFGMGMTQSSSFIHLAASLTGKEIAIASMSWYLSANIGMLVAANLFNALHNTSLLAFLKQDLREIDNADKVRAARKAGKGRVSTVSRPIVLFRLIVTNNHDTDHPRSGVGPRIHPHSPRSYPEAGHTLVCQQSVRHQRYVTFLLDIQPPSLSLITILVSCTMQNTEPTIRHSNVTCLRALFRSCSLDSP